MRCGRECRISCTATARVGRCSLDSTMGVSGLRSAADRRTTSRCRGTTALAAARPAGAYRWRVGAGRRGVVVERDVGGGGRLVGRRRLRDGDVVRVGGTLIAFCAPGEAPMGTSADDSHQPLSISPAQRRVLVALCRPAIADRAYAAPPSNAELAGELFLSVDSIKTHLKALFEAFSSTACRRVRSAPRWSSGRCG